MSLRQASRSFSVLVEENWAKFLDGEPRHKFSSVFGPVIVVDVKLYILNLCFSLLAYTYAIEGIRLV